MSFKIYVANYPLEFSKNDVENLFREFKGARLEKIFRQGQKCFSFILCSDIDQVVSIVEEKNQSTVGGRKLKVKAADKELQEYVDILLEERKKAKSDIAPEIVSPQVKRNGTFNPKLDSGSHQDRKTWNNSAQDSFGSKSALNEDDTNDSSLISLRVMRNSSARRKRFDSQKDSHPSNYNKEMQQHSPPSNYTKGSQLDSPPPLNCIKESQHDSPSLDCIKESKQGILTSNYSKEIEQDSSSLDSQQDAWPLHYSKENQQDSCSFNYSKEHQQDSLSLKCIKERQYHSPTSNYCKESQQDSWPLNYSKENKQNSYSLNYRKENQDNFYPLNYSEENQQDSYSLNYCKGSQQQDSFTLNCGKESQQDFCPLNYDKESQDQDYPYVNSCKESQQNFHTLNYCKESQQDSCTSSHSSKENQQDSCTSSHSSKENQQDFPSLNYDEKSQDSYSLNYNKRSHQDFRPLNYIKENHNPSYTQYGYEIDQFSPEDTGFKFNEYGESSNSPEKSKNNYLTKSKHHDIHQYQNSHYDSYSQQYANDYDSYYYSNGQGVMDNPCQNVGFLDQYDEDLDKLIWVSVTNFPLGTSVDTLHELFYDYYPIYIHMVCNVPRKDKTLTEAIIGFSDQAVVDDVILNFDNTMFLGRLLLVNDMEHLTAMQEMLVVNNKS